MSVIMQNVECIMHNFGSPADLNYIATHEIKYNVVIGLFLRMVR